MLQEQEKQHSLIGTDRVEGTVIYSADKNNIGSVDKLLIDKQSGKVTDAIISVGGFLGIGDEKHSVPWAKLKYDNILGGYHLDVTKEQLTDAPRFKEHEKDMPYDRGYQNSVYDYWSVAPYWQTTMI